MSTAAKSRQLNLDELLRLKWLLGGSLALVSLWTVFFLDIEALGLVAAAGSMILLVQLWPQLPGKVPALVWKLAVPGIIVVMAFDFYSSPDTLPVLIRTAILLVLYRAVGYRRKREDLQLLVLGLFLIVVAGVLTVAIEFAFLLLLFTGCALGFLFIVNLIDAAEGGTVRTAEAATAWTRLRWIKFLARLRSVADWRMLGFAAALFTAVVIISGLLFLIIPRFELASGFFLDRYITRKSRSGFSDTVRFGDVGELIQDNSVAMRVDVTDSSGIREEPYWRLVVMDEYTPEGFRVSSGIKGELIRSQRIMQTMRGRPGGRNVETTGGTWTFYIEPGVSRYLPLPGGYGLLRLRDPVPVQASPRNRLVALRTEPMTMTAFQLENVELNPTMTDAQFPQLLEQGGNGPAGRRGDFRYDPGLTLLGPTGPENEAVLRRIVGEITQGESIAAAEFARRATAWLQARHAYSLSVRIPPGSGRDDIVRWLDSNEPGFCEYFAAGLTVLTRAAGHPTRLVAGFRGGVRNGFQNYFMIRNSDAHAWAEIHDGSTAWFRVDPTPGSGLAAVLDNTAAAEQAQDSSWSARMDSLRVLWYRRIVNFDSRQQVEMIDQVKTFTTDSGTALRERMLAVTAWLKQWFNRPWDVARVTRVIGFAAGIVAAGWVLTLLLGRGWRRWRSTHRPAELDPVRRRAGQWLGRLRPLVVSGDVLSDLRRLRYGRRETWPEPQGVFKRAGRARKSAKT